MRNFSDGMSSRTFLTHFRKIMFFFCCWGHFAQNHKNGSEVGVDLQPVEFVGLYSTPSVLHTTKKVPRCYHPNNKRRLPSAFCLPPFWYNMRVRNIISDAAAKGCAVRAERSSLSSTVLVLYAIVLLASDHTLYASAQSCTCGLARNQQLLQLFNNATGGASWYTPWSGSNMCAWTGVTCNGTEVSALDLTNNNLRGLVPCDILQQLTSLSTLTLPSNHLTGSLCAALAALTNMINLNLLNNSLTGSLPPQLGTAWSRSIQFFNVNLNQVNGALPASYGDWTLLQVFDVGTNNIAGSLPTTYGQWKLLTGFSIVNNRINSTLPTEFGAWRRLTTFNVGQNQLVGTLPDVYRSWGPQMVNFWVSNNRLSGTVPGGYGDWTSLLIFDCGNNNLNGTLSTSFATWTALTSFSVVNNAITGTLPTEFGAWRRLTTFNVGQNQLVGTLPDVYRSWGPQMTGFWVYNNQLTGTVPGGYGDWTSMTNFDCSYNSINGTLPDSFGQWTHLEEFKVCTNMLFGTLPAVYSNFVVSFVTVSYNGFSGTLPPEYGASWGPTIRSFYAADNQLRGIIPASYAAWTSLQIFDATKNSLEGTLPLMISAWTQMTALTLGNNRFTGTIPASYAALRGSLVTMYLYCNQLEGGLPDEFRSMSALRSLFLNGNQNLTCSLPSSWGTPTNILRLASFSLQNTSITGSIPPTWSSVILPQGFIALCGTDVCGAGGLTGSYSLCVDDVAACDPRNQSYFIAHSTLYLPPACSSNNNSTPAPSSAATSLAPTPPPSAFSIPANHSKSNAQQSAVLAATAPIGIIAALAGSASSVAGSSVRAGATMRLVTCGDGDDADLLATAGGYLGAYCIACVGCCLLLGWHIRLSDKSSLQRKTRVVASIEHLGIPGRLWGVLSSVVAPLVEFGLSLVLLRDDDDETAAAGGGVALGGVSLAVGVASLAWLCSTMTWRFHAVWRNISQRSVAHRDEDKIEDVRGGTLHHRSTFSLLSWSVGRCKEYDESRGGDWVDSDSVRVDVHQPSFVECNGAVFEEYGYRRTWFVLWENGLAALLSVLSAVSRLSSGTCNATQVVGAVLQMCGLPTLVAARPHRKAKALLLAAAMESFGFVGGLCLLVSATTLIDGDPWGDAASVVLQIQLYAGVALLIVDGLHTGRIRDALRRLVATGSPSSLGENRFVQRQPFDIDPRKANGRPKRDSNTAVTCHLHSETMRRNSRSKNNTSSAQLTVLVEMICSRHTI